MLDDMRECFAAGAFRLGLDPNTTDAAQLDQILAELEAQKPIVKRYTTDHIADMAAMASSTSPTAGPATGSR